MGPVASESLQHHSGRPLLRSWFFILTLILAFGAWVIALTGQTIASIQISRTAIPTAPPTASPGTSSPGPVVPPSPVIPPPPGSVLVALPSFFPVTSSPGTLWFALIAQLIVFFQLFSALYSNTLRTHTPLLVAFSIIVIVLAAFGVDDNLFSPATSQKLTAAGWLTTAIVDCLWVLCLTAGDGTYTRRVFDFIIGTRDSGESGSSLGAASAALETRFTSVLARVHGTRLRRSKRKTHNGGAGGTTVLNADKPREAFVAPAGYVPPVPPSQGTRASKLQLASTVHSEVASAVENVTPLSSVVHPHESGQEQEMDGGKEAESESEKVPEEELRAVALYTYTGPAEEPNELSFKKGEVLQILDRAGKWWEARKEDGSEGTIPSNYMRII
ncbi:hypothetical protein L208DRAFT_1395704 [Tricholoma matsutake]|nr:hypothetical protein L208DRAFT_1395704 [Tricholoma matsutake 945]